MNTVFDGPTMKIAHGLSVISNSHHNDGFFFFVLKLDIIIGPYMRNSMF